MSSYKKSYKTPLASGQGYKAPDTEERLGYVIGRPVSEADRKVITELDFGCPAQTILKTGASRQM
jgi:hypothetical protein